MKPLKPLNSPPHLAQNPLPPILLLLFLTAFAINTQARSLAEIIKSKEIRICVYLAPGKITAMPPDCRDNCQLSGSVHETALAFVKTLGRDIQPKFTRVEIDELFFNKDGKTVREDSYTPKLLAEAKCDLYPGTITKNEWRLKKVDFVTLLPSRMAVIINKSKKAQFTSLADLEGKTAGVPKDTNNHTWLQEQNLRWVNNPVKIKIVGSLMEGMEAVDAGKLDFTLMTYDAAIWTTRNQLKNSTVAFPVGNIAEDGWVFRKEDKDLQAAVQNFFNEQRPDPNSPLNRIWFQYFGRNLIDFITLVNAVQ